MTFIQPSIQLVNPPTRDTVYSTIETAGRTCYLSEPKGDPETFIKALIKRKHLSVLEHEKVTFKVTCSRAIADQWHRHRIASYSQESTRYVNYAKKGLTFVLPSALTAEDCDILINQDEDEVDNLSDLASALLLTAATAEDSYLSLVQTHPPEDIRGLLPLDLAATFVCTMNFSALRHFFALRLFGKTGKPHPDIKLLAEMLFDALYPRYPAIFEDMLKDL